jgi:hypothetical protein
VLSRWRLDFYFFGDSLSQRKRTGRSEDLNNKIRDVVVFSTLLDEWRETACEILGVRGWAEWERKGGI